MKYNLLISTSRFMLLTISLLFLHVIETQAQDIHFSQFYAAPLLTNPANTGMSGDNLRVANIYRNQWSSIGVPYETFYASADKKITASEQVFGIGGFILHDRSSSFGLLVNEFMVSASYSRIISNQQFTFGLQPGFVLKSVDYAGITFNSQFNPSSQTFDQMLPSLENGMGDRMRYFDLNAGIFWRTMIRKVMPSAGFSLSHINMPVQRFLTSTDSTRLPVRFSFNGDVTIPVSSKLGLKPLLLYSRTNGTNEFLFGTTGEYKVNWSGIPVEKLYSAALFRINPWRDIDAFILGVGAGFFNFNLGVAYDLNISPLHKATNFNGAFEISLIYNGNRKTSNNINQPCYIIN